MPLPGDRGDRTSGFFSLRRLQDYPRDSQTSVTWVTSGQPLLVFATAPIEAITENHLDDQPISAARQTKPDPGVELPLGAKVEVDHREELVLLLMCPIKVRD